LCVFVCARERVLIDTIYYIEIFNGNKPIKKFYNNRKYIKVLKFLYEI